jgi:hypothetical protein
MRPSPPQLGAGRRRAWHLPGKRSRRGAEMGLLDGPRRSRWSSRCGKALDRSYRVRRTPRLQGRGLWCAGGSPRGSTFRGRDRYGRRERLCVPRWGRSRKRAWSRGPGRPRSLRHSRFGRRSRAGRTSRHSLRTWRGSGPPRRRGRWMQAQLRRSCETRVPGRSGRGAPRSGSGDPRSGARCPVDGGR